MNDLVLVHIVQCVEHLGDDHLPQLFTELLLVFLKEGGDGLAIRDVPNGDETVANAYSSTK